MYTRAGEQNREKTRLEVVSVYIEMPEGFKSNEGDFVLKLIKALYGIHQAPREWYLLVRNYIVKELGCKQCATDSCLFWKKSKTGKLILLAMFVDDYAVGFHQDDTDEWMALKKKFTSRFKSTDKGDAQHMLGMRIKRDRKRRIITLDQEVYITKKLEEFGMIKCADVTTPEVPGRTLEYAKEETNQQQQDDDADDDPDASDDEDRPVNPTLYMKLVGALLYAAISTRPDISHAVHQLSCHSKNPLRRHWQAGKRVLRYLQGTRDIAIQFGGRPRSSSDTSGNEMELIGYADSDYANDEKEGHLHQPAKDVMDRWHGDLQGPIRVEQNQEAVATAGGNMYWFNIIDEKSHKRLSRAIPLKSSAGDVLIDIIKRAQVQTGKKLKEFHSDDGGEFRSEKLQKFLRDNGTKYTVTQMATPQHNPIAERDGRTVMNMVVSMLHQSGLPAQFWAAAASMAVYVLNRTVNASNSQKTPEEIFSGYQPSVKAVRVFGCDGYVNLMKNERSKIEPKAIRTIYIGPDEDRKGHRMFNTETKRVIISRDVVFHEDSFSFARAMYGNGSQLLKTLIVESSNGRREVIEIEDDDDSVSDGDHNGGARAASPISIPTTPPHSQSQSHESVQHIPSPMFVLPPMADPEEKEFDIDEIVRANPPHIGRLEHQEPEHVIAPANAPLAPPPRDAPAAAPSAVVSHEAAGRHPRHRQQPRGLEDSVSWDQVRLGRGQKVAYNMMAITPVEVYSKQPARSDRQTELAFLGMQIDTVREEDRVLSYQEAMNSRDKAEWKKANEPTARIW